jgi:hypothetical protein
MTIFQIITILITVCYALVAGYALSAAISASCYRISFLIISSAFLFSTIALLVKCGLWLFGWFAIKLGTPFLSKADIKTLFDAILIGEAVAAVLGCIGIAHLIRQFKRSYAKKSTASTF